MTPMNEPATEPVNNRRPTWWRRLAYRLWGYDFFVSYHWNSGGRYSIRLAEALREQGFDCFLDRSEFAGGDDWKQEARQALSNTQRLIVVGTREALSISEPVRDEVKMFSSRSDRIIPILFGERIPDHQRHEYPTLAMISERVIEIIEDAGCRETGPSKAVLDEIQRSHHVLRRRRLRIVLATVAMALLTIAAIFSTISFINAEYQRRQAEQALIESQRELAESLIDQGVRELGEDNRIGLLYLHRAYEVASRSGDTGNADIPPDLVLSRTARRLMAGWQPVVGLGLLHRNELGELRLSPDGSLVRTMIFNIDGEPMGYRFWNAVTGQQLDIRVWADDNSSDLEMTPDWSKALSWDGKKFHRWSLTTGESQVLQPPLPEDVDGWRRDPPPHTIDGRWSVVADGTGLSIWDMEAGAIRHTLELPFEASGRICFSSNGQRMLVVERTGQRVVTVGLESGDVGVSESVNVAEYERGILSPDGAAAALESEGGEFILLDGRTAAIRGSIEPPAPKSAIRFSPDGGTLVIHGGLIARVVDSATGQVRGDIPGGQGLSDGVFSPDGHQLAIWRSLDTEEASDETIPSLAIWNVHSMEEQLIDEGAFGPLSDIRFSNDGTQLMVLGQNGFEVYAADTGRLRARGSTPANRPCPFRRLDKDCQLAGFSPDGSALLALDRDGLIARVIRTDLPAVVLALPENATNSVLSDDATHLATVTRDGNLQLRDVQSGRLIGEATGMDKAWTGLWFGRGSDWVITEQGFEHFRVYAVSDEGLQLVDEATLAMETNELQGEGGTLVRKTKSGWESWYGSRAPGGPEILPAEFPEYTFVFSQDGRFLAGANYGDNVTVWDTTTGSALQVINPRGGLVQSTQEEESVELLVFSGNGERLLSFTNFRTGRIWDVATGKLISNLNIEQDFEHVVFSPDSEILATLHDEGVLLIDVGSGLQMTRVAVWRANDMAFSADGRYLYVVNDDAVFRATVPELPDQPDHLRAWTAVQALAEWSEQGSPVPIRQSSWEAAWEHLNMEP